MVYFDCYQKASDLTDKPTTNQLNKAISEGCGGGEEGRLKESTWFCSPLMLLPGGGVGGILTGLLGRDVDRGAGGPRPPSVVSSDGGEVDSVGLQPHDDLGGDIPMDSDLTNHGFPGAVSPV